MTNTPIDLSHLMVGLRDYVREQQRLPSVQEFATYFGYRSKSAASYAITKLVDKGFLSKDSTGRISLAKPIMAYPVLGAIRAGHPDLPEEEVIDHLAFDDFLVRNAKSTYLIKVSGDSMNEAGIFPNDIVVVEKGKQPRHGDVVVAILDGEWTLKYFYLDHGLIQLVPANKAYPILEPRHSLVIWGVVVSLMRR
ncbi:MAG: LexA family transcriptional regulator, partial [Candidatus Margulisiibacteriota bacterium]